MTGAAVPRRFRDKVVVVTGSAQGIGEAGAPPPGGRVAGGGARGRAGAERERGGLGERGDIGGRPFN